jgi:hypothetical protein
VITIVKREANVACLRIDSHGTKESDVLRYGYDVACVFRDCSYALVGIESRYGGFCTTHGCTVRVPVASVYLKDLLCELEIAVDVDDIGS